MQVKTGKGPISLMVVIAIWSLSLAVDLPGLAITPMLDSLNKIFGNVSHLEVQLLTVLPNVLIIPFVLLAGKLSLSNHKIAIVVSSLVIYLVAGILYLFSSTMTELIIISCLLGVGCGLLIPFSTGLVADVFVGKYRMKQMGIISAIGNVTVVAATFLVGYIVEINWHLPFLVYLIPIVPLILAPWLKKIPADDLNPQTKDQKAAASSTPANASTSASTTSSNASATTADSASDQLPVLYPARPGEKVVGGFYIGRTIWLLLAYFFFVYATTVPSIYMSYVVSSEAAGTITSVFYLAMVVLGFALTPVLKLFKRTSFVFALLTVIAGFAIMTFSKDAFLLGVAYCLMGIGNGMAQPIFYDKATENISMPSRSTLSLAFLMVANYAAISLAPEIVSGVEAIFHVSQDNATFPFTMNLIASIAVFVIMIIRVNGFVFGIKKEYYE